MSKEDIVNNISSAKKPRSFILDAATLEFEKEHEIVKANVKQNGIRFEFPAGFAKVSIIDECRALSFLDDFDVVYDLMMGMLVDKDVVIKLIDNSGKWSTVCMFHVTHKDMDLRGVDFIDEYPVVVTWMCEMIAGMLRKKYPTPGIQSKFAAKASKKSK